MKISNCRKCNDYKYTPIRRLCRGCFQKIDEIHYNIINNSSSNTEDNTEIFNNGNVLIVRHNHKLDVNLRNIDGISWEEHTGDKYNRLSIVSNDPAPFIVLVNAIREDDKTFDDIKNIVNNS